MGRTRRQILRAVEELLSDELERDEDEQLSDEEIKAELDAMTADLMAEGHGGEAVAAGPTPPDHRGLGFEHVSDEDLLREIEEGRAELAARGLRLTPDGRIIRTTRVVPEPMLVVPVPEPIEPHPLELQQPEPGPAPPEAPGAGVSSVREEREMRERLADAEMRDEIERTQARLDRQAARDWRITRKFENERMLSEPTWRVLGGEDH